MNVLQACTAIAAARAQFCPKAPLISTMSAMHAFDYLDALDDRLDSVPLMGGVSGLGLGISLAKPDTYVFAVDGDASLLMELGSLVTVANAKPKRFLHILMHNNTQFSSVVNFPTPAAELDCDFAAMAKSAGYEHVHTITEVDELTRLLPKLLTQTGATFLDIRVVSPPARIGAHDPQPLLPEFQFERMRLGAAKLRAALAA